jgi:hypothetical protein
MKLSDAGLRRRQTKLIYPNHRPTPWLTKDATRDRSNQTGARTMRSRIGSLSAYTCHSATRPSRISAQGYGRRPGVSSVERTVRRISLSTSRCARCVALSMFRIRLTLRLSDVGTRCPLTKLIYPYQGLLFGSRKTPSNLFC